MRNSKLTMALVLAALIHTPAALAKTWHEYKSENFTVYSDVSEQQVNEMMRDLERFRRAALTFTGLELYPVNQKLRVYHFSRTEEFLQFAADPKIAGFYRETWDGPVIFSRKGGHGISGSGLIFHEYVHHLMRERSAMNYPKWYSEGFAELLASADLRKKSVEIGGVPEWRLGAWIGVDDRPLALTELLNPDYQHGSSHYWNNYYATAWLFTHYLQLGNQSGNPDYRGATNDYLQAVAESADAEEVFEAHFGKTLAEMQQEMNRYMRASIYGYRYDIPEYTYSIPRRPLSENERRFLLADNALELGKEQLALDYLQGSESHAPGWQENQTAIAIIKGHRKNFDFGNKVLEDIDFHGQLSYVTATQLAHIYVDRLQALAITGDKDEAAYLAAVKFGKLAVQLNPHHLSGYRYLWMAYQQKGEQQLAVETLMNAYEQEPNHLQLNAAIGFYLAHIGKQQQAREFLERVLAWSHSEKVRAEAEKILSQSVQDRDI